MMRRLTQFLCALALLAAYAAPAQAQMSFSGFSTASSTTLTGDVTGTGTGTVPTTVSGLTLTKLASIANNTILGNVSGSSAAASALTTLPTATLPALTGGDVTSSAGSTTLTIGASRVTTAMMANLAGSSLLGNPTGSPAAPSAITLAGGLTFSGTTLTAAGALTPTSVVSSGSVTGSNLSGTNTGDQTITLTGPVTGSGTGSFATSITAAAVTYAKIQNVAATSILGNPTGSTAAPSEIALGPSFTFSGSTMYGASDHPGYVSLNWYSTIRGATVAAGAAFTANAIKLLPFTISKPITISALAARVTTQAASGNFQLAVYGNNALTGRPTSTAICTTGSISTASTGAISGTATCTGALAPGAYWGGVNIDSSAASTVVFQTIGQAEMQAGYLIGSTTLANVTSGAATSALVLSVSQTFGTWPDLTSASFTEQLTNTSALVYMKAQ